MVVVECGDEVHDMQPLRTATDDVVNAEVNTTDEVTNISSSPTICSYKIVGDNIDKNIRSR